MGSKDSSSYHTHNRINGDPVLGDRSTCELYQSFMTAYVRRINEATFKVTIGGVKIGSAKYTRLAQINLKSRIITFSRFAVDGVPERGRRYLVLHELAHVEEASHNKRFWQLVARFEPNYKRVSEELERAFKKNIREDRRRLTQLDARGLTIEEARLALSNRLLSAVSIAGIKEKTIAERENIMPMPAAALPMLESNPQGEELLDQIIYEEALSCADDDDRFDLWDGTEYGECPDD